MERVPSPGMGNMAMGDARPMERGESRVPPGLSESRIPPGLMDDGRERGLSGAMAINPYDITDIKKMLAPTDGKGTIEQVAREVDIEWKAHETYGKPNYHQYQMHIKQGWRPVHYSDFPERFAPAGAEGAVRLNDMILMHRPMRLTVKARKEEYDKAVAAMQVHRKQMAETPEGQAPRVVLADRSTREAIEIPE